MSRYDDDDEELDDEPDDEFDDEELEGLDEPDDTFGPEPIVREGPMFPDWLVSLVTAVATGVIVSIVVNAWDEHRAKKKAEKAAQGRSAAPVEPIRGRW